MTSLPADVLQRVFDFCPRIVQLAATLCCKEFRDALSSGAADSCVIRVTELARLASVARRFAQLRSVSNPSNAEIGAPGLRALRQALSDGLLPSVARLDLSGAGLSGSASRTLWTEVLLCPRLAPQLTALALRNNSIGRSEAEILRQCFASLPVLERLDLSENRLGPEEIETMFGGRAEEGGGYWRGLTALRTLDLREANLNRKRKGRSGASALAEALCAGGGGGGFPRIQRLGLRGNALSTQSLELLCEALSVRWVALSALSPGDSGGSEDGGSGGGGGDGDGGGGGVSGLEASVAGVNLSAGSAANPATPRVTRTHMHTHLLRSLDLGDNDFTTTEPLHIAISTSGALRGLQEIDVGANPLAFETDVPELLLAMGRRTPGPGSPGGWGQAPPGHAVPEAEANAPRLPPLALRRLGLSAVLKTPGDVQAVQSSGALTPALTSVDLGRNRLGAVQGVALLGALLAGRCFHLRELQLADNRLGLAGMQELCGGLLRHPLWAKQLARLDVSANMLDDAAVEALAAALAGGSAPRLEALDLSYNNATKVGIGALAGAVVAGAVPALSKLTYQGNRVNHVHLVDLMENRHLVDVVHFLAAAGEQPPQHYVEEHAANARRCRGLLFGTYVRSW
jgi:Leucine-rich repeat (LRR) protein